LQARRKPQAFAADAVSLWIFNRSQLIINELVLSAAKLMTRPYPTHGPSIMAQSSVRGACGFVLADNTETMAEAANRHPTRAENMSS